MSARLAWRWSMAAAFVLALGAAWKFGAFAQDPAAQGAKPAFVAAETLGGAERMLTHLSTDKPIYRIGETVYLRGVLLGAHDRKPLPQNRQTGGMVQIVGPKGDIVARGNFGTQESVFGFAWKVPEGQAGGEYTAKVTYPWEGHAPAERKFDVRVYRAPRLKSQIVFVRDGYGPGDAVSASIHVERAEGGVPEGAGVTVIARVDGAEVHNSKTIVTPTGDAYAHFDLPKEIERGEGTLAFVIEDGGVVETATKTIPILLQTVDLQLYPEGGDLVAGLENRVYFEARTPAKKPADIAGIVEDGDGNRVGEFRTEHEGRGRFTFKPEMGKAYQLKITEPSGIARAFPLPAMTLEGVVLRSTSDVVAAGEPVSLTVDWIGHPAKRQSSPNLKLTLSHRELEVASAMQIPINGKTPIELDPGKDVSGVLIVTVWDNRTGAPLAERLVFRQPANAVKVTVAADRERHVPGDRVSLKVKTTDEAGKPVSAVVGVTVTDESVLEMIEKREQTPRLPVMVFLEDDVRELADAHVYLDPEDPKAPLAVDLLLGTQGWRRFAFVDTAKFIAAHGDPARRVLALKLASAREERGERLRRAGVLQRDGAVLEFARPLAARAGAPPNANAAALPAEKAAVDDAVIAAPLPAPVDPQQQGWERKSLREALDRADEAGNRRSLVASDSLADLEFPPLVYVREYAHAVRENRQPGERSDFTETLYWNAGLKTDEKTGEAKIEFALSDSVTSFRVLADAFDSRGALGAGTGKVESVEPFYVEPKLPLQLTSGDVVNLPIGIVNATLNPLSDPKLAIEAKGLTIGSLSRLANIDPDARIRQIARIETKGYSGTTDVVLSASAGGFSDKVTRPLDVRPLGFPIEIGKGGMLDANSIVEREILVPGNIVPGSVQAQVRVFPTPLASMTGALERLIQEPYGCFEQTSSSTYPLVMAQQYFLTHTGVDPKTIERAGQMLDKGYDRLVGYECKGGGYEWFGQDPGHEALTAYGLMEFHDMAQVRKVDPAMLERTRKWLFGRRDGKGGFPREGRTLHTWLPDPEISNSYITWSLLSAGENPEGLKAEIDWVEKAAGTTKNSYVLALAANVMVKGGRKEAANRLMDRLVQLQTPQGDIQGATTSIVGSGGEALAIETTALASLAWLSDMDYIDFADKGVRYLADHCKAGRFGSTQSTILALKAIVEQDRQLARPKANGSVQLLVDGKPVGKPVAFDKNTQGAIELPEIAPLLTPGRHTIALRMSEGSSMPFSVAVNLYSTKPDSSDETKVAIRVSLADARLEEGGLTEARVVVENRANETVPMPMAIVGIPGGLEVRHDQLKELVKAETIAAYEVLGRDVVLYWRDMGAGAKVEVPLSLVAAIPGEYTGPASRAYLYYTDEHKQWAAPLSVTITPRGE